MLLRVSSTLSQWRTYMYVCMVYMLCVYDCVCICVYIIIRVFIDVAKHLKSEREHEGIADVRSANKPRKRLDASLMTQSSGWWTMRAAEWKTSISTKAPLFEWRGSQPPSGQCASAGFPGTWTNQDLFEGYWGYLYSWFVIMIHHVCSIASFKCLWDRNMPRTTKWIQILGI